MLGTLGFSYIGLLFLCCLFVPNIFYGLHLPIDHLKIKENKILLAFERTGQVLCTILVIIFDDFNIHEINLWTVWLGIAFLLMVMYLLCWGRYFLGNHVSRDFYRSFLGIPLPLAVLPVAAVFFTVGIWESNMAGNCRHHSGNRPYWYYGWALDCN